MKGVYILLYNKFTQRCYQVPSSTYYRNQHYRLDVRWIGTITWQASANKTTQETHRMYYTSTSSVFVNVELRERHVHRNRMYTLFTSLACHWLRSTTLTGNFVLSSTPLLFNRFVYRYHLTESLNLFI